ncbi:MAG: sigma-54-dependent Fis family transcriptional regulator, partial [Candidatus Omnitrophica bacterium]|nr:sigma-54-dependent Fis family transcriptional regulator [Candidatus Omnitrophota bacterium]
MSKQKSYSILIVDDDPLIRKSLYEFLKVGGDDISTAHDAEEARVFFSKKTFDVVITDMKLPQMSGLALLEVIKKESPTTEVIIITGYSNIEIAVDAMKKGAFDYVTKPIVDDEIKILIEKIIEKKCLLEENRTLRQLVSKNKRVSFCGMIGNSAPMQTVYNLVESVADTNATV